MCADEAPLGDEAAALLAKVFAQDGRAARVLTETILLPTLEVAVARLAPERRGRSFEREDVIQEVFKHICEDGWRRLRGFDPARGSLANYVWGIANGWLRDHSRRLPPPQPAEDLEKDMPPDSGPESTLEMADTVERLRSELTEEELALFQWVYLEDVPLAEVARRLSLKMQAVYKRAQRMEAKVRKILETKKKGSDPEEGGQS